MSGGILHIRIGQLFFLPPTVILLTHWIKADHIVWTIRAVFNVLPPLAAGKRDFIRHRIEGLV
jgi:hypothetical protein